MRKMIFLTIMLSAACGLTLAQGSSSRSTPPDILLDRNKPAVRLTFERLEAQNVLLRLHNNTRWWISVPTVDPCVSSTSNSGPCWERSLSQIIDGHLVEMRYLGDADTGLIIVKSEPLEIKRIEAKPDFFLRLGDYKMSRLASGHSALFLVARAHLSEYLNVYVPFVYEWDRTEDLSDDRNLEHRVYFRSYDLSQAIGQK
jgi:hypothetical protein